VAVPPTAPHVRGERHKYLIAIAVVLAAMMQLIDTSIVNVAIPHMMGNLGASLDEIAWVSTGYILASVIVIPLTGFLSAYFGRKRYFVASVVIFTIASFFCGSAHTLQILVFWRVVQGLGGGALIPTSQAVLLEAFPPEEAGTAMAFFGMGMMVGPTLGPTLGGYITDNYSWPWIFYINLPIGVATVAMISAFVHDSPHHERTRAVDGTGIALVAVAAGSIQYVLEHGQREDWFDSGLITGLTVAAVVAGILLVWRELTAERPAIDFRVMRHRQMWVGTLIGVMLGVGLFGTIFVLPVFLQGTLHMTAWQTGLVILPGALASAVAMGGIGRVGNRVDPRLLITAGTLLFLGAMWQLSRITADAGAHDFFWPLILRGLGLGLVFVPLTVLTLAGLEPRELPQATGQLNFFRQLGGSFGIALMATLLVHYVQEGRAVLASHVSMYDFATQQHLGVLATGFASRGADALAAHQRALTVVQGEIAGQASVIAFGKLYLVSAFLMVASLPLLLLLRRSRPGLRPPVISE